MYPIKWKEITEERYVEMLSISLPPAIMTAYGFLVGEAWRHNGEGRPMFQPFIRVNGRFYEGDAPITCLDFKNFDAHAAAAMED